MPHKNSHCRRLSIHSTSAPNCILNFFKWILSFSIWMKMIYLICERYNFKFYLIFWCNLLSAKIDIFQSIIHVGSFGMKLFVSFKSSSMYLIHKYLLQSYRMVVLVCSMATTTTTEKTSAVFVYVFFFLSLFILPFVSLICWFNALLFENFICFATCNAIARRNTECRLKSITSTEKRKKKYNSIYIFFFAQFAGCISNDRSNCWAMNKYAFFSFIESTKI